MKLRKYTKIILALLLIAVLATSFTMVFADASIPSPKDAGSAGSTASNIVGALIFIIQIVAFGAAVIMLMFLGIKYITASPDGKAEIKKSSTQYIVGAIILFAASGILQIVKQFATDNVSSGT